MSEFMESHVKKIHPDVASSPGLGHSSREDLRGCPECGEEMKTNAVIKHCRLKHKVTCLDCWVYNCILHKI